MEIKVNTNISNRFQKVEIQINAPERNEEIKRIEENITNYKRIIRKIVGKQNNSYFILDIDNVIKFYSEEKNNYCKTKDGEFRIKEQLYYLEEVLPTERFIRISNSVIINVEKVKCFNTDTLGKIVVELKDGSKEDVARRKNSDIMKFLKNIF